MTGLLQTVASAKPREKAGAHTMARYGFQVHASILKVLELHKSGADYRAVFDHFDDLMVFDKSDQPTKVAFFQIKSQDHGEWTLKQMASKKGKGGPPASFLGRLHHHMATFGQMVSRLGFVSNLGFRLKLLDGKNTTLDHHIVCSTDLHSDEIKALKSAVANDATCTPVIDGIHLFVFERISLGLTDQDKFVKGCLLDFVQERGSAEHVPVIALYQSLQSSVFSKTGVTQEFTTTEEFCERKTLCRTDIEEMFSRAENAKRFHDNWLLIAKDLAMANLTGVQIIRLHNSCIRYVNARASGEPGATAFYLSARAAIASHLTEFAACGSLPDIAGRLRELVPSDYEDLDGALYVEAFEAIL